ncbi:MAG TPA: biotin transporter BioY [Thermoanaerobaculia bacterium]
MTNANATIPSILSDRIRGRAALNMLLIAGASVVIAIAAQIAVPIPGSPVPLTMQPLAVLLVGVVLGSWRGAAASALYLMEGAGGLPVFAQSHGGIFWLTAGATAGYLLSYPFAAFVAGWVSERGFGSTVLRAIAGMLAALAIIYVGGWSWLAALSGTKAAFAMGIAPFLIADIIKVALGAALLPRAQKAIARLSA